MESWLSRLALISCKVLSDILVLKSILKDLEVSYDDVSLLGNNRAIVSFKEVSHLKSFINFKDSFKDFFVFMSEWNEGVRASNILTWINVYGIPLLYWHLDFSRKIGNECGEFVSLVQATLSKSRVDMATILISTNHEQVPLCLRFSNEAKMVEVKLMEITTEVLLADEDGDGGSDFSSNLEDVAEGGSESDSFQKSYDSSNDNDDLISKINELSDLPEMSKTAPFNPNHSTNA